MEELNPVPVRSGVSNRVKVGILGPGAVGGFLATILERAGTKTLCLGREKEVEMLSVSGLALESEVFGRFSVYPRARSLLEERIDILFITTKAAGLKSALQRVPSGMLGNVLVIPLLNGFEHMRIIKEHCGEKVAAGAIGNFEAERIYPNLVRHYSGVPRISLASGGLKSGEQISSALNLLSGAGIKAVGLGSEAEVLWGKLVRLGPMSMIIAASRRPLGEARRDSYWRKIIQSGIEEAVRVAGAEGAKFDPRKVMDDIDALPPGLYTSMYRDLVAGRESELDAIAGAIVRAGEKHGIACPTFMDLIKKIASG